MPRPLDDQAFALEEVTASSRGRVLVSFMGRQVSARGDRSGHPLGIVYQPARTNPVVPTTLASIHTAGLRSASTNRPCSRS